MLVIRFALEILLNTKFDEIVALFRQQYNTAKFRTQKSNIFLWPYFGITLGKKHLHETEKKIWRTKYDIVITWKPCNFCRCFMWNVLFCCNRAVYAFQNVLFSRYKICTIILSAKFKGCELRCRLQVLLTEIASRIRIRTSAVFKSTNCFTNFYFMFKGCSLSRRIFPMNK